MGKKNISDVDKIWLAIGNNISCFKDHKEYLQSPPLKVMQNVTYVFKFLLKFLTFFLHESESMK